MITQPLPSLDALVEEWSAYAIRTVFRDGSLGIPHVMAYKPDGALVMMAVDNAKGTRAGSISLARSVIAEMQKLRIDRYVYLGETWASSSPLVEARLIDPVDDPARVDLLHVGACMADAALVRTYAVQGANKPGATCEVRYEHDSRKGEQVGGRWMRLLVPGLNPDRPGMFNETAGAA